MRKLVYMLICASSIVLGVVIGETVLDPARPKIAIAMPSGFCGDFHLNLKSNKSVAIERPESYIQIFEFDGQTLGVELEVPDWDGDWEIAFSYLDEIGPRPLTGVSSVGSGVTYMIRPANAPCKNEVQIDWHDYEMIKNLYKPLKASN